MIIITLYPPQQPLLKCSLLLHKLLPHSSTFQLSFYFIPSKSIGFEIGFSKSLEIQKGVFVYICYNYFGMTKSLIAFLSVVLILQAQQIGLVANYQAYTELNSPQFVNIVTQIYQRIPELAGFKVVAAQRQLVNGYNYIIDLKADDGSTAQVKLFSTFNSNVSIRDYTFNKPAPPVDPINGNTNTNGTTDVKPQDNTTHSQIFGAYSAISDLPANDKQDILNELYRSHPEAKDYKLVKLESQLVSGTNYKFTYQKSDGTPVEYVVYVPIGGLVVKPVINITNGSSGSQGAIIPNQNITRPLENDTTEVKPEPTTPINAGGKNVITDPKLYKGALDAILKEYPSFTGYTVASAESQVVAGTNYYLTLVDGPYNLANFQVFADLAGGYKVSLLLFQHAYGFTPAQVQRYVEESIKRVPSISKASLIQASNIWPLNKEGLKLKFQKPEGGFTNVYVYAVNGADSFSSFDS